MYRIKPIYAALLSGTMLALSWPNLGNLTPLLFIGFVPLFILSEKFERDEYRGSAKYLLHCYVAFLTWNFIDTYWLFYVQGSFGTRFMSAFMPSFLNAFLMALPWWLFFIIRKQIGKTLGLLSIPCFWIAYEYLHLNWDLSWPWLVIGNCFAGNVNWVQWYEYTGVLGGTFWVIVANILVYVGYRQFLATSDWKRFISPLLFIVGPIAASYAMLDVLEEKGPATEEVIIVQPNIDAYGEKFELRFDEQLRRLLALSETQRTHTTRLLLFPETALQEGCGYYIDEETHTLQLYGLWENQLDKSESIPLLMNYMANKKDLSILTGIPTNALCPDESMPTLTSRKFPNFDRSYDSFNTAMWISNKGFNLYHKSKLVPAAEILPFATVLKPILGDAILDFGGSSSSLGTQEHRVIFSSKKTSIKAAPVICYESIYGSYVTDYVVKGANLICIMTNDGWWGTTAGHKHHLAYAKLRAIETRRDVVRSANTGISAYINQKGEILESIPYDQEGTLKVYPHLNKELTFYSESGDYIGFLMAIGCGIFLVLIILRKIFPF